ncbi:thermonuclease family protein [Arthrobacter sp. PAMC25284]|uniref:thermonuclease family protein n=1 Tax=Arthrobacter sp. PAMC25284 TaxID=2861279 RepID=UPI001C634452|nr:thermonuclease family protein [Arthrobacter sp. PAMC25284]QYF88976.1 thermonuclease family protein [Arthrobacter sp. PAMC25284]
MLSPAPARIARARAISLVIVAAFALTACTANGTGGGPSATNKDAGLATVLRVIDGDTFEAAVDGEPTTIRLLNVDSPETKDPQVPVECLGPEATKGLEGLLPVGSKVRLELDVEPLDKYGRTLAGVFSPDGTLVNAEVARLGLGVPVLIEPNKKFYPPVEEAFAESRTAGTGLNSADIPCLPAQQVGSAADAIEAIVAAPLSDAAADLDQRHAGLVAALATISALKSAATTKDRAHWAAYKPAQLAVLVDRLDAAASSGVGHQDAIAAKKQELADAAAAEASRQAEEAARQATAAAAAAAEAERIRNLPPVPAPYVPPAYVPPAYVPPAYVPPAAPNPYPGYTGPRCYAPGGKSWKPC